jgi:glutamate/tyrosine decarboxylase-like PLP-dependent enzyme
MGTRDPLLALLEEPLQRLAAQFADLPACHSSLNSSSDRQATVLDEVATRLGDNYPYFHPLYAGQMLKPPHPVAHAAYTLAMSINPNNHARDGGRASSEMEIEAVSQLAAMFGWTQANGGYLGHLTSSGTFANLEALWIAGQLAPGKRILAQEQAHYTHQRISAVLQLPFTKIAADPSGRMDLNALEDELRKGDVGAVVATIGATALGTVDPLPEILALKDRYGFRLHLDAAYGGYFRLLKDAAGPGALAPETAQAYALMDQADSIVIDPHKHGLQPYGCGCILFRDPTVGPLYKHDSPYTYFTSSQLHLGEISLECSRAGAAAVALWATQRLLPLTPGGEFALGLQSGRAAALDLHRRLQNDPRFHPSTRTPDLDIVVWKLAAPTPEIASAQAQQIFDRCARLHLHLALVQLPEAIFGGLETHGNTPLTCLRSVLMKPEHAAWLDAIWDRLDNATGLAAETKME